MRHLTRISQHVCIYFCNNILLIFFTYIFMFLHPRVPADSLCPGKEYMPMLYIPRLILKIQCNLRYWIRRAFRIALSINSISYSVGIYICICIDFFYQLSSFFSLSSCFLSIYLGANCITVMLSAELDIPMQLLPQPQQ